jgi:Protein of unknown function (DUF2459)
MLTSLPRRRTFFVSILCLWLVACTAITSRPEPRPQAADESSPLIAYVVRRGWHVDVGMAREDLTPPLSGIAAGFPGTRYVLFGFGDQRYLLHGANISGAIWPGAGILLVTTVSAPQLNQAFPGDDVASLVLSRQQMSALQDFVAASLSEHSQAPQPVAPGPYAGSAYYASVQRYSAVHTCNTWAAEALQHAGLPVASRGVEFSWQLWHQVQRIERERPDAENGTTRAR